MLHTSVEWGKRASEQAQGKQQKDNWKLLACKNENIFKKLSVAAWGLIKEEH